MPHFGNQSSHSGSAYKNSLGKLNFRRVIMGTYSISTIIFVNTLLHFIDKPVYNSNLNFLLHLFLSY